MERDPIDREDDLLLRKPHDQHVVGMVLAHIVEHHRGAAELEDLLGIDGLVRHHHIVGLERQDPRLGIGLGDEGRAHVLERLAAGDMVEVAVAVDHVLDRRLADRLDGVDIGLHRPPLADRIGRDHAVRRGDEHRLVAHIAEYVDVVGALDLGEGGRWLLGLRGGGERGGDARDRDRKLDPGHSHSSTCGFERCRSMLPADRHCRERSPGGGRAYPSGGCLERRG